MGDGKIDKQLLMHIFGMAKKGGMREPLLDELLGVVREQAKIDEEAVKQQAATYVNPPYDLKSLGLNQQGTTPVTFDQMLADSFRTGWKEDHEWDCFIEIEAFEELTTDEIDRAVKHIQTQADTEEVPVRLCVNGYRCIAYPGGKWTEALTQWHEAKLAARSQAKVSNFSVAPTMITMNYTKADADATMKMHVLKNRTVPEGQKPDHFFGAIRDFLGDKD